MNKEITTESAEVYSAIEEIEEELNSRSQYKQKIEELRKILKKAESEASKKMIDSAFVNRYIDKIYVTPIEDGVVEISVKIFTGDIVEKHLTSLRNRHKAIKNADNKAENKVSGDNFNNVVLTGHTFKKMIESYENSMK